MEHTCIGTYLINVEIELYLFATKSRVLDFRRGDEDLN